MTTDERFDRDPLRLAPRRGRAPRARPPRRGPRADRGRPASDRGGRASKGGFPCDHDRARLAPVPGCAWLARGPRRWSLAPRATASRVGSRPARCAAAVRAARQRTLVVSRRRRHRVGRPRTARRQPPRSRGASTWRMSRATGPGFAFLRSRPTASGSCRSRTVHDADVPTPATPARQTARRDWSAGRSVRSCSPALDGSRTSCIVADADGTSVDPHVKGDLVRHRVFRPGCSPDGTWIAFAAPKTLGPSPGRCSSIHPDGTGLRTLLDDARRRRPATAAAAVSPDGDATGRLPDLRHRDARHPDASTWTRSDTRSAPSSGPPGRPTGRGSRHARTVGDADDAHAGRPCRAHVLRRLPGRLSGDAPTMRTAGRSAPAVRAVTGRPIG